MRRLHRCAPLLAALALGAFAVTAAEPAAAGYRIARRIAIGGEGGWDLLHVDPAAHRLYVSHSTRAVVVDTRTDRVLGEITPAPGVHGIATDAGLGRGWTSNGRDSSVTVFDSRTLATIASVKLAARNPDGILFDGASGRVFVLNGGSASTTVLDATTNAVAGTVELGGKPEFGVTDGAGRMWITLEDSSAIVELDTRSLAVLARWPLAPGEEPTGLAFDRARHRLFAACGNRMLVVMDSRSGRVVGTVPIGAGADGAEFDAKRGVVLVPSGEGTLSVIHEDSPDRYRVLETAATERGARTLALDPANGTVYTVTADFGPPPEPTPERPHPRPSLVPGTFRVLVVQP